MSDKEDYKVGDRVQCSEWEDRVETVYTGTITALVMGSRTQHATYYNRDPSPVSFVDQVTVKWDDGEEETLKAYSVEPEDSEIEREFRNAIAPANARINEKLALAEKYLDEALAISEETGIPFGTSISYISQSYRPRSLNSKFEDINMDKVKQMTETYNEYEGWEHSAVCN